MNRPQVQIDFEEREKQGAKSQVLIAPVSPIRRAQGSTSPLSGASFKWDSAFESAHERYGQRPVSYQFFQELVVLYLFHFDSVDW